MKPDNSLANRSQSEYVVEWAGKSEANPRANQEAFNILEKR